MLLVSVRSEEEARAAVAGGAAIVDVKEPSNGSLGRAPSAIWSRVRAAIPRTIGLSVALGELADWTESGGPTIPHEHWAGVDHRKIGLAGAGPCWRESWRRLRERIDREASVENPGCASWVAVAYLDWDLAQAPDPELVIEEAAAMEACSWVLFDTWDKSRRGDLGTRVSHWIRRAKQAGRFVALAGSLDEAGIRRMIATGADLFAVRGSACRGGDRNASIDPERVARLVEAAGG